MPKILLLLLLCLLLGCEDTDLRLASQAGIEAVQALTLSDDQVNDKQDKNFWQSILDLGKKVLLWTVNLVEKSLQFVLHLLGKGSAGN